MACVFHADSRMERSASVFVDECPVFVFVFVAVDALERWFYTVPILHSCGSVLCTPEGPVVLD